MDNLIKCLEIFLAFMKGAVQLILQRRANCLENEPESTNMMLANEKQISVREDGLRSRNFSGGYTYWAIGAVAAISCLMMYYGHSRSIRVISTKYTFNLSLRCSYECNIYEYFKYHQQPFNYRSIRNL